MCNIKGPKTTRVFIRGGVFSAFSAFSSTTYWLTACSLVDISSPSRHCSLASWTAPLWLLIATIFREQASSSESSRHFSARLSPAPRKHDDQKGKKPTTSPCEKMLNSR